MHWDFAESLTNDRRANATVTCFVKHRQHNDFDSYQLSYALAAKQNRATDTLNLIDIP